MHDSTERLLIYPWLLIVNNIFLHAETVMSVNIDCGIHQSSKSYKIFDWGQQSAGRLSVTVTAK